LDKVCPIMKKNILTVDLLENAIEKAAIDDLKYVFTWRIS